MNPNIFKPHLQEAKLYKGGISKSETGSAESLIKLSSNENLLGCSPKVLEAIQHSLVHIHEYPDGNSDRLRVKLSEHYNGQLSMEQFVCGNSGSECLEIIIRGFLDPGLECIMSTPTFMPYLLFSKKMGAEVINVPLLDESYALDIQGILSAINDKTRLIFLTNPNNPTGNHVPASDIQQLLSAVPDHVIVVIDEVYKEFVSADDYTTGRHWLEKGYPVIGLNSLSKAYGLAGLRVGYMYSNLTISNYLNKLTRPFYLNSLSLNAGIAALEDKEFVAQTRENILDQRPKVIARLKEMSIKAWPSQTNFVLVRPEIDSQEFTQMMLAQGVMVRPVDNFGAAGCVRITIGRPEHNDRMLRAVETTLESA